MREQTNKNIVYYLSALLIFIVMKFGYTRANADDMIFLLKPIDKLLSFLVGSHSLYLSNRGYYYQSFNILIDKSCSGFNFWALCFLLFTYLLMKYVNQYFHKLFVIPIALSFSYVFTIFVNTSRIFTSIVIQSQTKSLFANYNHLIHESIGIITNVFFLILSYYLIEKFLKNLKQNAKFA